MCGQIKKIKLLLNALKKIALTTIYNPKLQIAVSFNFNLGQDRLLSSLAYKTYFFFFKCKNANEIVRDMNHSYGILLPPCPSAAVNNWK